MYAVQQDMVTRFGNAEMVQLTNDALDATQIGVDKMNGALADASAEIDGYLQGQYALPLANPPAILTIYCCDIARYRLFDARATEQVQARYDAAIRYLKQVGAGTLGLGLGTDGKDLSEAGGVLSSAPGCQVFTSDKLKDYTRG